MTQESTTSLVLNKNQSKYSPPVLRASIKTSVVVFINVKPEPKGVKEAVEAAMAKMWKDHMLRGKSVFVKVNLISSEYVPGQCTSPLVLDAVLKQLTERGYDVTIGDADLAAARQCNKAAKVWGHKKLAEKYGVRFQNLSEDKLITVRLNGKVFKTLDIPKSVLDADSILNLPVMKTHCLTGLTCSLKHFWGVVPRIRHQYHLVVDNAIADITGFLKDKIAYTIVDGTIGMEGNGPRTGRTKVCNVIMASADPVALDSAVAVYMGLPTPKHVTTAAERGVGLLSYDLEGDEFKVNPFQPSDPEKQPIFKWEMAFRASIFKPLLFDTPIFDILAWIATKYNSFWYYKREGRKYVKEIVKKGLAKELKDFVIL